MGRFAPAASGPKAPRWLAVLAAIAATSALALALLMAWRKAGSEDLGYHLAYGDAFLAGRGVVSDATLVWPRPTPGSTADTLPPGAWFDPTRSYRFPNGNWLSQVAMAAGYRLFGGTGLTILGATLVLGMLLAQGAALHRAGAGLGVVAFVWLLTTLCGYERFNLRPELFGLACLAAQLGLLCGPLGRPGLTALVGLQLLAVNFHTYWILGVLLSAAFAVEALCLRPRDRERGIRLGAATLLMILVGAVHPHGWRNLALPFQTLAFLRRNGIVGSTSDDLAAFLEGEGVHPWRLLGEFHRTFDDPLWIHLATPVFFGLVVLALAAALAHLVGRRIGWSALTLAMIAVGVTMRRNILPAALVLGPAAALAATALATRRDGRSRLPAPLAAAFLVAITLAAIKGSAAVVSDRLYREGGWPFRFGSGLSPQLPISTCHWLDATLVAPEPVFTDFNLSSNLAYFGGKVKGVPLLTNTWAMPVERMRQVLEQGLGRSPFAARAAADGFTVAILDTTAPTGPLVHHLARSAAWALVRLEPQRLVFARRDRHPEMTAITSENFDLAAFHATIERTPEARTRAIATLQALGWNALAEALRRAP